MEEYPFRQVDDIVQNIENQSKDIKRVYRQIRQAHDVLKKYQSTQQKQQRIPKIARQRKQIYQGKRGGLYYLNRNGNKVYLTPSQCQKCVGGVNKTLGCPPPRKTRCPKTRAELKNEIGRLRKIIEEDC